MNYLIGKNTPIGGVSLWHLDVQSVVAVKFGVRYGAIGNGCFWEFCCPIAAPVVVDVFSLCADETVVMTHLRVLRLPRKSVRLEKQRPPQRDLRSTDATRQTEA